MLNVAKSIIPKYCKNTQVPTTTEWLLAVDSIHKSEETAAISSENTEKFHKLWRSWFLFKYSDSFDKMQNGWFTFFYSFLLLFVTDMSGDSLYFFSTLDIYIYKLSYDGLYLTS